MDETQEVLVIDFQFQLLQEPLVVHRVEELLDVHFHDDALLTPRANDAVEAAKGLVS